MMDKMTTVKKEKKPIPFVESLESEQSEAFDILFKKEPRQDLGQFMYGDLQTIK